MGKIEREASASRRQGRRWRFASAEFDEASWTLKVDGVVAQIEGKPLELLHELLLRAGEAVSKDELLAAVWPGLAVVEASLPTAVLKLRRALKDDGSRPAIIETVPRIGYRLAAVVEMTHALPRARSPNKGTGETANVSHMRRRAAMAASVALVLVAGVGVAAWRAHAPTEPVRVTQQDANDALRKLDVPRIEALLRAGWNPNTPFDGEGNGAINTLLNMCEWDPAHDRHKMVLMVRTLIEGGARVDTRNVWGDTPYSIAKAPRFCGPDHPVTRMLYSYCYAGYRSPGDKCLAARELKGNPG